MKKLILLTLPILLLTPSFGGQVFAIEKSPHSDNQRTAVQAEDPSPAPSDAPDPSQSPQPSIESSPSPTIYVNQSNSTQNTGPDESNSNAMPSKTTSPDSQSNDQSNPP